MDPALPNQGVKQHYVSKHVSTSLLLFLKAYNDVHLAERNTILALNMFQQAFCQGG